MFPKCCGKANLSFNIPQSFHIAQPKSKESTMQCLPLSNKHPSLFYLIKFISLLGNAQRSYFIRWRKTLFSVLLAALFPLQLTGHQIPRQLLIKFQQKSHLDEGDKHDQVAQEHSFHSSTSLSSSSSPPLSLLSSPLRFSFRLLPPFIPFPCLLPFPALLTTYSSLHSPCSRFSHHLCFFFFTSPPLPHVSLVQSPPPTQLSQSEGFTCLDQEG